MVRVLVTIAIVAVALWIALIAALWFARPKDVRLADVVRLVPDVARLFARLARDRAVPRSVRVEIRLLAVYLAIPVDVVPDFIPVVGWADDAILVYFVLRRVVRATGDDVVARHWPGSPAGLTALRTLVRSPGAPS